MTKLGADHAILYKDNDWAAEVKKLSGGVDVVLDMVAGDYLPKNLQLLKQDGRCVVIALQGGATATISAGIVMVNRLTLTGSTLRPQSIANKGRMAQGLKEKVWPLLEAGTIRPIIYKTFPLEGRRGGACRAGARRPRRQGDDDRLSCRSALAAHDRLARRTLGSSVLSASVVVRRIDVGLIGLGRIDRPPARLDDRLAGGEPSPSCGRHPRARPCGAPCRPRR